MLRDLFTWWLQRLRELLPLRIFRADQQSGATLLVATPDGLDGPVSLILQRGRNRQALGIFAQDAAILRAAVRRPPSRIVLCLPDDLLFGRDLVLPLAAERDLRDVIGYEIDRVTPFAATELFWTYAIRRRDKTRGKLVVQLFLMTRAPLQPLLDVLSDAGMPPTLLDAAMPDGERTRMDPRDDFDARSKSAQRTNRILAMVCAGLIVALAATPFVRQSLMMAQVERKILALSPSVEAVEAARRRMVAGSAGVDLIAADRQRLGDTLAILAAVTDVMPDDTNLTDLSLRQGRLTLSGQSTAAARLIAALAANPMLRNPGFAAPVTRLNDGRGDQFAIHAEIAP